MMQTFYKNDDTPDIPDVEMTWAQLLVEMRTCLQAKGFAQIPQLSTSYNMHLGTPFTVKPTNARRTKALLIGINYVGHQVGVLSGCHNDVRVMKQFIVSQGFSDAPDRMRTLMDDGCVYVHVLTRPRDKSECTHVWTFLHTGRRRCRTSRTSNRPCSGSLRTHSLVMPSSSTTQATAVKWKM